MEDVKAGIFRIIDSILYEGMKDKIGVDDFLCLHNAIDHFLNENEVVFFSRKEMVLAKYHKFLLKNILFSKFGIDTSTLEKPKKRDDFYENLRNLYFYLLGKGMRPVTTSV